MIFTRGANEINVPEPDEHYFIYRISGNNKSYVGMSKDVIARFDQHLTGRGSQLLLHDIVDLGIKSFKFEILAEINADKSIVLDIEDIYITKFNCLSPNGYNLRMNHQLVVNGTTNPDSFAISCKFVHANGNMKFFSIGQYTNSRSYQTLINLPLANCIKQKKKFKYDYIELSIETDKIFQINETYELNLRLYQNELLII
jgi:hypothetical protein